MSRFATVDRTRAVHPPRRDVIRAVTLRGPVRNTPLEESHAEMRRDTTLRVVRRVLVWSVILLVVWWALTGTFIDKNPWLSAPLWWLVIGIVIAPLVDYLFTWGLHHERPATRFARQYLAVGVAVVVMIVMFILIFAFVPTSSWWMHLSGNYYIDATHDGAWLTNPQKLIAILLIVGFLVLAIIAYIKVLGAVVRGAWRNAMVWAALMPIGLIFAIGSSIAHNTHWS